MKKSVCVSLLLCSVFWLAPAYADEVETQEDPSCQAECPQGESRVSFADVSRVVCVCSPTSTGMDATPETAASCADSNDDGQCD